MPPQEVLQTLSDIGVKVRDRNDAIDEKIAQRIRGKMRSNGSPRQRRETPGGVTKIVTLPDQLLIRDLAQLLEVPPQDIQKYLLLERKMLVNLNQPIDRAIAREVAERFGFTVEEPERPAVVVETPKAETKGTASRPPVVTIMGHVDHGKTTLLDAIRHSRITEEEFGGITQHIGAYQVEVDGRKITFLDTPGHAAFTAMRARGAQVTDIAVLVVAADDGVMPQTIEAINHARVAGVPIIVAVNKVDKPDANPLRTREQLAEQGLVPEEWGGDTICVDISAKEGRGLDDLLTAILVLAEELNLRADPYAKASGVVIEAELERGRGPVATVLVQNGTLRTGDVVVAGTTYGRIRSMVDDHGRKVNKAGPSTPVEISGLSEVPHAGDRFEVVADEKQARAIVEQRLEESKAKTQSRVTLLDFHAQRASGQVKDLPLIVKGDVQGSVEAVCQALEKLSNPEVRIIIIHAGVGPISESDVLLASASNAIIIGFNVRVEPDARRAAENEGVDIRTYRIIYDLINDVSAAINGLLQPVYQEVVVGTAQVRAIFKTSRGIVAGCYITNGRISRGSDVRVIRNGQTIYTGRIASLRHLKEDVRELPAGFECGILLENFNEVKEGDIIECFTVEEVRRSSSS